MRYSQTHAYSLKIPEGNIPSCPICRTIPPQNNLEVIAYEEYGIVKKVTVEILHPKAAPKATFDKQLLFEELYTVYSIAHAGIAYLQQHQELAAIIFKVQRIFIIVDFIGFVFASHFLYQKIREKQQATNLVKWNITAIASIAALQPYPMWPHQKQTHT